MTTDPTATQSRDELVIELPPVGFLRGGRGMIPYVAVYAVILMFGQKIVRMDARLSADHRHEHELYWVADQMQRALGA